MSKLQWKIRIILKFSFRLKITIISILKIKSLLNLYSPYYHSICNFREKGYFECTIQSNNSFLLNYMQFSSDYLQHNCENLSTYKIVFRWCITFFRMPTNWKYIFTKTKRKQGKFGISLFFCCYLIPFGYRYIFIWLWHDTLWRLPKIMCPPSDKLCGGHQIKIQQPLENHLCSPNIYRKAAWYLFSSHHIISLQSVGFSIFTVFKTG